MDLMHIEMAAGRVTMVNQRRGTCYCGASGGRFPLKMMEEKADVILQPPTNIAAHIKYRSPTHVVAVMQRADGTPVQGVLHYIVMIKEPKNVPL